MSLNHLKTNQVPLEINRARTSHTKIITQKKIPRSFPPINQAWKKLITVIKARLKLSVNMSQWSTVHLSRHNLYISNPQAIVDTVMINIETYNYIHLPTFSPNGRLIICSPMVSQNLTRVIQVGNEHCTVNGDIISMEKIWKSEDISFSPSNSCLINSLPMVMQSKSYNKSTKSS